MIHIGVMTAKSSGDREGRLAVDQVSKAIAKTPTSTPLLVRSAMLNDACGHPKEAESLYRRALELDPKNAVTLNNLAWHVAIHGGNVEEALALIGRASQQVGFPPELLDTRAIALLESGRVDQAISDLESSLAIRTTPSRYFHLARAQIRAKRMDDARRSLSKANELGLDPHSLLPAERVLLDHLAREVQESESASTKS
ncbi:tetratricopeptide repeat protein [Singulisphaera rosea]